MFMSRFVQLYYSSLDEICAELLKAFSVTTATDNGQRKNIINPKGIKEAKAKNKVSNTPNNHDTKPTEVFHCLNTCKRIGF